MVRPIEIYGYCKNGAELYAEMGTNDFFHNEKCLEGCLPINVGRNSSELYGYEECIECKTKPDQSKGVGLWVGTINGKMYHECSNCGFSQAG